MLLQLGISPRDNRPIFLSDRTLMNLRLSLIPLIRQTTTPTFVTAHRTLFRVKCLAASSSSSLRPDTVCRLLFLFPSPPYALFSPAEERYCLPGTPRWSFSRCLAIFIGLRGFSSSFPQRSSITSSILRAIFLLFVRNNRCKKIRRTQSMY